MIWSLVFFGSGVGTCLFILQHLMSWFYSKIFSKQLQINSLNFKWNLYLTSTRISIEREVNKAKLIRLQAGSNHRPLVYKTSALATELWSQLANFQMYVFYFKYYRIINILTTAGVLGDLLWIDSFCSVEQYIHALT